MNGDKGLEPAFTGKSMKTRATSEKNTRRARMLKVYTNPQTGESIKNKGSNHKQLKSWKTEHGSDELEL